jgi:hypothetical protein
MARVGGGLGVVRLANMALEGASNAGAGWRFAGFAEVGAWRQIPRFGRF